MQTHNPPLPSMVTDAEGNDQPRSIRDHSSTPVDSSRPTDMKELSVAELSRRCNDETLHYRCHEPYVEGYGLELFRRAIIHQDEAAWAALYTQYSPLVHQWLGGPIEEADREVSSVFMRFWQAVDAEKFARFTSLAAILQYLKMCAHTAQLDRARAARAAVGQRSLDDVAHTLSTQHTVEEVVFGQINATALWRAVKNLLAGERERLLIHLSYVVGLSPQKICVSYPMQFPDVTEVYRIKRNVLDRLRRSPEIRAMMIN